MLVWLGHCGNRYDLADTFSLGLKLKLGVAGGLIHEPEVMGVNEALAGLDAAAARDVKYQLE